MKTKILFSIVLVSELASLLSFSQGLDEVVVGEKKSYKLFLAGEEAGFNTYYVESRDEEGYHIRSKVQLDVGIRMTFYEELVLTGELAPRRYTLKIFVGDQLQEIEGEFARGVAKLRYRLPGEGERTSELQTGENLVILDNNIIDHYAFIARRYDYPLGGRQAFSAVVSQAAQCLPLTLEMTGQERVEIDGQSFDSIHLSGALSGIGIHLWVDPTSHQLLKLAIPGQSFEAIMAREVIDFPEEELEKRLAETKGKAEEGWVPEGYGEEEVTFLNEDVKLAGTLTVPELPAEGKYPGLVFIAGSGPVDRNGNAGFMRGFLFRQMADALSKAGLVTLRYDKRGVGESSGDLKTADLDDLTSDAAAAVNFLRSRGEVNPNRIGLIGHSEGAVIGPILCGRDPKIAASVVMAGPGRSLDRLVFDQVEYLSRLKGLSDEEIEAELRKQKDFFEKIRNREPIQETGFFSPEWWRQHMEIAPLKNIKKVQCPILILNGAQDYQVSAVKDAQKLAEALKEVDHPDYTLKVFPNLDHLFMRVEGRSTPELYLDSSRKIDPEVLHLLTTWLNERLQ